MILGFLKNNHGIHAKKVSSAKGGEYHSPCPRCGGTDCFHVWPEQNEGEGSFWCRRCGIGGDCIKFLMHFNGLSFKEAAARTGKKLEKQKVRPHYTPIEKQPPEPNMEPRKCQQPVQKWQQQALELVMNAGQALQENKEQLNYLATRGISAQQAAKWGLGFIGGQRDCLYSSRSKWGLDPKTDNKKPNALWIPRGIAIPNFINDRVDSIRIRRPKKDRQRIMPTLSYHVMPGSGTAPLLNHRDQPVIVVVESQLDAILLDQFVGDLVGVLALGNSSARPDDRAHDALSRANLILVALDSDEAGQTAAEKWLRWYDTTINSPVPTGKDPSEAYQQGVDLRQWIIDLLPSVWIPTTH
ncbi:MAG: CHC2 zinc finger domain-containing protein [Desulfuromonas sp.]|nr:CHC2 zinc finger domain-containing protein [Desulfuromonas sp.]